MEGNEQEKFYLIREGNCKLKNVIELSKYHENIIGLFEIIFLYKKHPFLKILN